jgi:hypothetical protein
VYEVKFNERRCTIMATAKKGGAKKKAAPKKGGAKKGAKKR